MNTDPFDPANLTLPEDFFDARQSGDRIGDREAKATEVRRYGKRPGFQFCQFPVSVLDALIAQRANWTAFAVLAALYELWFTNPNHHNPVELTSYNLRRFGLSRQQKWRALWVLEKSKQITVERMGNGKNPLVTLNWLPLVNRKCHPRRAGM
jgi:hypothetical protein